MIKVNRKRPFPKSKVKKKSFQSKEIPSCVKLLFYVPLVVCCNIRKLFLQTLFSDKINWKNTQLLVYILLQSFVALTNEKWLNLSLILFPSNDEGNNTTYYLHWKIKGMQSSKSDWAWSAAVVAKLSRKGLRLPKPKTENRKKWKTFWWTMIATDLLGLRRIIT
jgi:hypothetical protein